MSNKLLGTSDIMLSILYKLFYLFDQRIRLQIVLLFGLMLLSAILETGGIGLIIPFISVIVEPQIIERNQWLRKANEFVGAQTTMDFLTLSSVEV